MRERAKRSFKAEHKLFSLPKRATKGGREALVSDDSPEAVLDEFESDVMKLLAYLTQPLSADSVRGDSEPDVAINPFFTY